jgi:hypothetical protein
MSWRQAQEYEFSEQSSPVPRYGESWSGQAQAWIDLFDFAWGCAMRRNMERTLRRSDRFERPSAPFAVFISLGSPSITKGTPSVTR